MKTTYGKTSEEMRALVSFIIKSSDMTSLNSPKEVVVCGG